MSSIGFNTSNQLTVNGSPLQTGLKNIIINGAMNVWQYGTTATTLTTSGLTRMTDRWNTNMSVTSGAIQTTQDTTTQYNGQAYTWLKNTVTTVPVLASGSYTVPISYIIEDNDIYNLRNGNVTLSFLFNTNVAGTYSVALRNYAYNISYVTTFTAVSGTQKISLTFNLSGGIGTSGLAPLATPSNTGGLNIVIASYNGSISQTSTLNTWISGNYLQSTTSTNWTTTVGNYVAISQVQLEEGSIATPFEQRPISLEKKLCQYYARPIPPTWDIAYAAMYAYGQFHTSFEPMRVTPTVTNQGTFIAGGGANGTPQVNVQSNGQLLIVNISNNWAVGNGIGYTGGFLSSEL